MAIGRPALRERSGRAASTSARWIAVVVLALIAFTLVRTVIEGGAFGHDESVYAVKARSWVADTPATGWGLHRAPLLSVLIAPIVAFTESEVALRSVGVGLALFALVTLYLLTRRLEDGWAGLLAIGVVGASLTFQRRGSELLTDAGATGLLLAIAILVLAAIRDPEGSRRRALWIGPLAAAAFYMRYPSALAVLAMAIAFAVVAPHVLVRLRRELLATAGMAFALLLPHLIWATAVTGAPWGVVFIASDAGNRAYFGEGLADYAAMFPVELAGPAGAVLMTIGVVWSIWALWTGLRDRTLDARTAGFVIGVVAIIVLPLGFVVHGEARYVLFPAWMLVALGAMAVVRIAHSIGGWPRLLALALAVALWIPVFVVTANRADRNAEARAAGLEVLVEASEILETEGAGSCGVLTGYLPQVTWYSRCYSRLFRPNRSHLGFFALPGDNHFVLLFEEGRRQPTPAQLPTYLGLGTAQVVPSEIGPLGDATIVTVNQG